MPIPLGILANTGFVFPSGLIAWYDASDTSTITASGGAVSQWNDKSGNGNNVTQSTESLKPTTGSVTVNGLNAISFNIDRLLGSLTPNITSNSLTVFTCGYKDTSASAQTNFSRFASLWNTGLNFAEDYSGTAGILGYWRNSSIGTTDVYRNNAAITSQSYGGTYNAALRSVFRLDGTNVKFWHKSQTPTTGTTSATAVNINSLTIGDANQTASTDSYLTGAICEHLIFNRALTDAEVDDVRGYLADKWGAL